VEGPPGCLLQRGGHSSLWNLDSPVMTLKNCIGLEARLCKAASITASLAWPFCTRTLVNPATPLPKELAPTVVFLLQEARRIALASPCRNTS